jgi:hypothetical protein
MKSTSSQKAIPGRSFGLHDIFDILMQIHIFSLSVSAAMQIENKKIAF